MENKHNTFILFKTEDEKISVDVRFDEETVWLTQEQMALLFGKAKSTINEHIQNVFKEGELNEGSCIKKFGISEFQQKASNYYNLDVIISLGYRVKSLRGTGGGVLDVDISYDKNYTTETKQVSKTC